MSVSDIISQCSSQFVLLMLLPPEVVLPSTTKEGILHALSSICAPGVNREKGVLN